jgi:outer membrane protein TolC
MNKIILLFFVLQFQFITGQNMLSLQDAIRIGQEVSPIGKQIRAAFQSNQWQFKAAKASRLPQLGLTGSAPGYTKRINQNFQPDGSFIFSPIQQAFSNGYLSLNQNVLATGGRLSVGSGLSRGDIFSGVNSTFYQSNLLAITINQPLFKFNALKWQWKQDRLQMGVASRQQIENLEDLSINITQRYFDLYTASLELKNAEFNQAINDTIYKIAKGRFGVGKIAENELLQVELSFTNARNAVEKQKLSIILAERQLQLLLGQPIKSDEVLPPLVIPTIKPNPNLAVNEARNNRSELLNWQINENQAHRNFREAQLSRRFSADMNISYGLNQTGATFNAANQNPLESQFAGINFSIPIASMGMNRAQQKSAQYNLEAQRAQNLNNQNNLEQEVFASALQFLQLRSSLEISAKADTIAQKRYEVARNRYRIGTVDITNLLIAQNEKDQALITYVNTLRDFWVAYYRLRRLTLYDFEKNEKLFKE